MLFQIIVISVMPVTTRAAASLSQIAEEISAQNKRILTRVVQPHPHLWRFIQCLKQEESVISHRMVQTGLGFSSIQEKKSTRTAARKSKQIHKLLHLLESKVRSLDDTIKSFAHLVGEPVCRGRKGKKKKNSVSTSDLSILSSDEYYFILFFILISLFFLIILPILLLKT